MFYLSDETLDRYIQEDIPYFDLTTWVLGMGDMPGNMEYFTREDAVLCGTEEVVRILQKMQIQVDMAWDSGKEIKAGDVFLRARGQAKQLHMAWKVGQNIFDQCSGIATRTRRMVEKAKSVNPHILIATTRKGFPGTKPLAIKSIAIGGALPHRLGLSETVLVFRQHMNLMGGFAGFVSQIPSIKHHICEKKLIVEAQSVEEGLVLGQSGVDGLQFDKLPADILQRAVKELRKINPCLTLIAAGGITMENVLLYAQSGVDVLVTTSLYHGKPIDMGVKIAPLRS